MWIPAREGSLAALSNKMYEGATKPADQWAGNRFASPVLLTCGDAREAVAAIIRKTILNAMNTKCLKLKWLIVPLALAVVGGGYPVARGYLQTQSLIRSEETYSAVIDRLAQARELNTALKLIQAGNVEEGTQRLSCLLSANIVGANAQLASASERGRAFAQMAFARMAQSRPRPLQATGAASVHELRYEETEAQKIFALAVAAEHQPYPATAASR